MGWLCDCAGIFISPCCWLSRTIEAEKFALDPSKVVHLELLIGHIWHSAYIEKKRLDRQGRTEAQSQGRLLYRGSIVFATEDAASLKRALPAGLEFAPPV